MHKSIVTWSKATAGLRKNRSVSRSVRARRQAATSAAAARDGAAYRAEESQDHPQAHHRVVRDGSINATCVGGQARRAALSERELRSENRWRRRRVTGLIGAYCGANRRPFRHGHLTVCCLVSSGRWGHGWCDIVCRVQPSGIRQPSSSAVGAGPTGLAHYRLSRSAAGDIRLRTTTHGTSFRDQGAAWRFHCCSTVAVRPRCRAHGASGTHFNISSLKAGGHYDRFIVTYRRRQHRAQQPCRDAAERQRCDQPRRPATRQRRCRRSLGRSARPSSAS